MYYFTVIYIFTIKIYRNGVYAYVKKFKRSNNKRVF